MSINSILAHDSKYGIGKEGKMPWSHNDADMKWFRECTMGHVVVMGRKTWESIDNKKLPKRVNFVVSRSNIKGVPDCVYYGTMSHLIKLLKDKYPDLDIWFIGGSEIYRQAMPLCDNIYVTEFPGDYECDTFVDMKQYLAGYSKTDTKEESGLSFSIWRKL
jgi:dihydrofolate reductase